MRDINHQILFCNVFSELEIIDDVYRINNGWKLLFQPSFNSPKIRKHSTPQPHQSSSKRALKNSTASKYCLILSQYCLFCNMFNLCIFHIWKTHPDLHKFSHKNSLTKVKNVMALCIRKYIKEMRKFFQLNNYYISYYWLLQMQFVAPMISCFLLKLKFFPSQIADPDLKICIF